MQGKGGCLIQCEENFIDAGNDGLGIKIPVLSIVLLSLGVPKVLYTRRNSSTSKCDLEKLEKGQVSHFVASLVVYLSFIPFLDVPLGQFLKGNPVHAHASDMRSVAHFLWFH